MQYAIGNRRRLYWQIWREFGRKAMMARKIVPKDTLDTGCESAEKSLALGLGYHMLNQTYGVLVEGVVYNQSCAIDGG
ncbi:hypothetical protein SUGI_0110760 [Cryptomeria japonica]|nr:hypothetical protein SUGI_0110760 [Cryptomeria japonica]